MDLDAASEALASKSALYADQITGFSDENSRGDIEMFGMKMTRGHMLQT